MPATQPQIESLVVALRNLTTVTGRMIWHKILDAENSVSNKRSVTAISCTFGLCTMKQLGTRLSAGWEPTSIFPT